MHRVGAVREETEDLPLAPWVREKILLVLGVDCGDFFLGSLGREQGRGEKLSENVERAGEIGRSYVEKVVCFLFSSESIVRAAYALNVFKGKVSHFKFASSGIQVEKQYGRTVS